MSTAIGRGLADPKRRGKPVSQANKGGRARQRGGNWSNLGNCFAGEFKDIRRPESKGNPVKIPEPEGWTGYGCPLSAVLGNAVCRQLRAVGPGAADSGRKPCLQGGDAKPTFGTLAVTLGRDLFSS